MLSYPEINLNAEGDWPRVEATIFLPRFSGARQCEILFSEQRIEIKLQDAILEIPYKNIQSVSVTMSWRLQICYNSNEVVYLGISYPWFYLKRLLKLAPHAKAKQMHSRFLSTMFSVCSVLILNAVIFLWIGASQHVILSWPAVTLILVFYAGTLGLGIFRLKTFQHAANSDAHLIRKLIWMAILIPVAGLLYVSTYLARFDLVYRHNLQEKVTGRWEAAKAIIFFGCAAILSLYVVVMLCQLTLSGLSLGPALPDTSGIFALFVLSWPPIAIIVFFDYGKKSWIKWQHARFVR